MHYCNHGFHSYVLAKLYTNNFVMILNSRAHIQGGTKEEGTLLLVTICLYCHPCNLLPVVKCNDLRKSTILFQRCPMWMLGTRCGQTEKGVLQGRLKLWILWWEFFRICHLSFISFSQENRILLWASGLKTMRRLRISVGIRLSFQDRTLLERI